MSTNLVVVDISGCVMNLRGGNGIRLYTGSVSGGKGISSDVKGMGGSMVVAPSFAIK